MQGNAAAEEVSTVHVRIGQDRRFVPTAAVELEHVHASGAVGGRDLLGADQQAIALESEVNAELLPCLDKPPEAGVIKLPRPGTIAVWVRVGGALEISPGTIRIDRDSVPSNLLNFGRSIGSCAFMASKYFLNRFKFITNTLSASQYF